ncbi:MAG: D-glycerate dehydrogenase [Bdellovibrio sp.]|nr:D-glycerate dehydrogenase [Bdellovibrio sp.]
MPTTKIFVTRIIHKDALDLLQREAKQHSWEIKVWPHSLPPSPLELRREAQGHQALLTMITDRIDQDLLDRLPELKVIANHAVGVDNIDLKAADKRGIAVGNTPDVLTAATAELGLLLTMALLRNLPAAISKAKTNQWGAWGPLLDLTVQLGGMEPADNPPLFGIYGMGRIGQSLARMLALGLQANVAYTNTHGPLNNLNFPATWLASEELLAKSDVLIVTIPSNPNTKGLFNQDTLKKLKVGAYFVNLARGDLHDEDALYRLLEAEHLAGVALDVTNPEPATLGRNPILSHPRAIITPHIGSATTNARRHMGLLSAQNIINYLKSKQMPHQVKIAL